MTSALIIVAVSGWALYLTAVYVTYPRTPPTVTTLLGSGDALAARKRSPHG